MDVLRTSELARAAAVNVQTLRYYERVGVLPAPKRTTSG
jgi:DNA-binding transcriptional MerR regulator